ncbi:MAG TPA: ABC transporter permease, partial [Alphaproteobacteria bacterium]|nr:ABC transporter permease [Alphaproteobacteria bacterium]
MKENSGETAGLPWLETLLNDVRFGARMLRKNPAFTLVAALTLALGIGANTAIFTVINAVFLHPIPVENPQRMVSLFTTDQRNRGQLTNFLPVSYPNGLDIQKQAQSFSGVALVSGTGVSMTVDGQADRYGAAVVSGNYFDVLGVRAALGRTFLPQEDSQPGAGPVIVISHGLWERKFGNDRNVIGKTVLLNGQGFTVIGVAPVGFQGTAVLGGPDMWVPMSMHDQIFAGLQKQFFNERRFLGFFPVARLKDGASPERARQELQAIGSTLEREYPIPNKGRSFTVVPLLESTINPNARASFTFAGAMMMGVVGFVLLIACVNIASLLMVRATARKREIAIRAAMGASRARVVSQLLTEAVLLALGGGIIGLGLAVLGRNLLWKFRPPFLLQTNLDLSLDGRVLLFTLGVTLATGLIFGLIPALQASRPDLVSELKERTGDGAVTTWRRLLRHGFVVGQVALSLIPLVGAGLFLLSLRNAQSIDPGFDTHNLAIITFNVGSLNYDPPRVKEFQRRVLETTLAVPGVKSATLAAVVPLFGGGFGRSVFPEGAEGSTDRNGVLVTIDSVSSDYLETMGIPLLRGRGFDSSVREDSPHVVIINETAARRFW